MAFDIDAYYDGLYEKVEAVPRGYLEYRLSYAPEGYVLCSARDGRGVYVRKREDGSLAYEDNWDKAETTV